MNMNKLLLIGLLLCCVWGCDEAIQNPDCGGGDRVTMDDKTYCVYQLEVVVENGFSCPPDLPQLSEGKDFAVCSETPLEREKFTEVRTKFEEDYPEKVKEDAEPIQCESDSQCAQNFTCVDGVCE